MARPKDNLTLWVEAKIEEYVERTLSTGKPIKMMRDYWYTMKGLSAMVQFRIESDNQRKSAGKKPYTDSAWGDKVNAIITKRIERMAYEDNSIYRRLGLSSDIFEAGEMPIVVIAEKDTDAFDRVVHKYGAGKANCTGQMPTFEAVFVADYLEQCDYSEGYIFVFTDYDPAGETIFESIKTKMTEFSTNTTIHVIHVEVGENIVNEVANYPLTRNALNQKWIDGGRVLGVEFNGIDVIDYMPPYLEASIEKHLDPRLYVMISKQRWINREVADIRREDDTYQEWDKESDLLIEKMDERSEEYVTAAKRVDTDFTYNKDDVLGFKTYQRNKFTDMEKLDIEHYFYLLGELSPYVDDVA